MNTCTVRVWTLILVAGLTSACSGKTQDAPANDEDGRSPLGGTGTGSASAGSASGGASTGSSGASTGSSGASTGSGGVGNGGGGAAATGEGASGGAGGAPSGQAIRPCLDSVMPEGAATEALMFKGPGLLLGIARRADPDGSGSVGTTPWRPERFALERGSAVRSCVSEPSDLEYASSPSNSDDTMTALGADETWVFRQTRESSEAPARFTIEGRRDDAVLWGPFDLRLTSCARLDSNESCAESYD